MSEEEILPIVDENDNIIGKEKRYVAKEKGLRYRQSVIFITQKNSILLQTRADNLMLDSSVAGHVQYGDDYIWTAIKELKEELNLQVLPQDLKEITKIRVITKATPNNSDRFITLYQLETDHLSNQIIFDPQEIVQIRFYSFEEIKELLGKENNNMTKGLQFLLNKYFSLLS